MIDLLNAKLRLVKKIEELTQNILEISLDDEEFTDSLNTYSRLLEERQDLMNQIDKLDTEILELSFQSNQTVDRIELKNLIDSNIKSIVKNIIDMDKKIKLNAEKELVNTKRKLNEIDKKIQTSDFEIDEEDKKPVGYFLNRKS